MNREIKENWAIYKEFPKYGVNKSGQVCSFDYNHTRKLKIIRATMKHRHDGKYISNYEALAKVENVIYRYLKETE